ncbi:two-component sensor histidine kinase [Methylomonas sp. LWB]|uniref:sensor histidine kinase n=1 Tax=Methylomonas sp. LWB TaxID=1905845 RepID=UPI0008DAD5B8|nr:ATP-binding protein [Methylomonas sp. LWB]OHX35045.1 two-component sensor histidine kinase [Methylomonas sp. LWB]
MDRLFWKFFFAFWLALLTAGFGVGSVVWLRHNAQHAAENQARNQTIDVRRAALIEVAARILTHGGSDALREFLGALSQTRFPAIFAVDNDGRDVLNRELSPEVLKQARELHDKGTYPDALREISAGDGRQYLLFIPAREFGLTDVLKPLLRAGEPHFFDDPPPRPPDFDRHDGRGPKPDFADSGPPPRDGLLHRGGPPPEFGDGGPPSREPPPPVLPIAAGTLAGLLFSSLLAWYFAKPIRTLRTAFAALAQGKLDTRIADRMGHRHDELSDLGRDFDHMAGQIGDLVHAQQRLLHDVSHELRSPLARIQAAIGLVQQMPAKLPATLERIERESQRMSDLIGELLMLSRLESGVSAKPTETVDLDELLGDIVADAELEAAGRIRLVYRAGGEILLRGDAELLHRAFENVIRNAVQHCRTDGAVAIALNSDGKLATVSVEDDGPGVPEAELEMIFQPFFRSRNHNKAGSTGLGLTIALRAVAAHRGSIHAVNRPRGGLKIILEFPLGAPSPASPHT